MKTSTLLLLLVSASAAAQMDPESERLYGRDQPSASAQGPAPLAEVEVDGGRWSMQHADLGGGRHRLRLALDRLHIGGDGEVRLLVTRWAEAFVRQRGLAGFRIVRLEEGVRPRWVFSQRYADAEVQFVESATFGMF